MGHWHMRGWSIEEKPTGREVVEASQERRVVDIDGHYVRGQEEEER